MTAQEIPLLLQVLLDQNGKGTSINKLKHKATTEVQLEIPNFDSNSTFSQSVIYY